MLMPPKVDFDTGPRWNRLFFCMVLDSAECVFYDDSKHWCGTRIHCFGTMALHPVLGLLLLFLHPNSSWCIIHYSGVMIHHQSLSSVIHPHYLFLEVHFSPAHFNFEVPNSAIISGRAQGYSRMAGSVGCHGPMVPCALAFVGAVTLKQTCMKQCRGRCWATFWAISLLVWLLIIIVLSPRQCRKGHM